MPVFFPQRHRLPAMRRVQNARANRQRVAFAAHAVPCRNRHIAGHFARREQGSRPQMGRFAGKLLRLGR